MNFQQLLTQYIEKYSCSVKELAEASTLSSAVISRYRSGEREPGLESPQLPALANGLAVIAASRNIYEDTYEKIIDELKTALSSSGLDFEVFTKNFITLTDTLQISMKSVSQATNFDTSYIYRVRSGQRHPGNLDAFIDNFCQYVVSNYNNSTDKASVCAVINCDLQEIEKPSDYLALLRNWLSHAIPESTNNYMQSFLTKLDEFDLNEYIKAIHFDTLKVPTVPVHLPTSKTYYGVENMKKAELAFFRETVLSKSKKDIFMCSDMPMEDMAKDLEFGKKWMIGIAASLKKGLHLNIIHNIDRPFSEMMLGLEAWIPIYMTGQISPYHLPNIKTNIYHHINYVSGVMALTGECINGHHDNGKYYLTNNKEELQYYQTKAKDLLEKAQPLMNIYREDSLKEYHDYESMESKEKGDRKNILSSPPLYTISEKLLTEILRKNNLPDEKITAILKYRKFTEDNVLNILKDNRINDEIPLISENDYDSQPVPVCLSGNFYEKEIFYSYKEYTAHLEETREFANNNSNYQYYLSEEHIFSNIQIRINEHKSVTISKEKAPAIHFVIKHPKMVNALSNFVPSVKE